jgi:anti-sigma-K factor RskA
LFELTLEPEGGSPYNRPSGPVLYIGRAVLASAN